MTVNEHASGNLSYGHVVKCGSVWICPVCSAKIVSGRRQELSDFIDRVYAAGPDYVVSMLTLTIPHQRTDDLSSLLDKMCKAKRTFQNRKVWKRISAEIGLAGEIRALEVTHGANGWHPHFHCLLIHKKTRNVRPKGSLWFATTPIYSRRGSLPVKRLDLTYLISMASPSPAVIVALTRILSVHR